MNPLRSVAPAALVGFSAAVALSAASMTAGSAAQLIIADAGVVQFWEFPFTYTPPPAPEPGVPAICGPAEDYAGVLQAEAGVPLYAPTAPQGKNLGWVLLGTDGDDVLVGANKNDCLVGGTGDDVLRGGEGRDILIGGPGADALDCEQGPDQIFGDEWDICTVHPSDDVIGCPTPVKDPKGPKPKGQDEPASMMPSAEGQLSEPEASAVEEEPLPDPPPVEPDPAAGPESDGEDQ